jgi:Fur family peroxide stress response transcriptional regulator
MDTLSTVDKLIGKGLKVTPQRIAILKAIVKLRNHPTADAIYEFIKKKNPNISLATVYKVLDVLVENEIIRSVKTDKDVKRYDSIMENHHHLYFSDSEKIEDYFDNDLTELLQSYFVKKSIPDFNIEDIRLQIIGKHTNDNKKS